jgi:heme/copper-type cytochrome/quinol oxidase subunit 2
MAGEGTKIKRGLGALDAEGTATKGDIKTLDTKGIYAKDKLDINKQISPKDLLGFAKIILFYLFALVVFVFAMSYFMAQFAPQNQVLAVVINTILDITKTAVPSIVTLVLGFYYGQRESTSEPQPDAK